MLYWYNEFLYLISNMLCPIKVNITTIELIVRTSCYWILDLFCVKGKPSSSSLCTHRNCLHHVIYQQLFTWFERAICSSELSEKNLVTAFLKISSCKSLSAPFFVWLSLLCFSWNKMGPKFNTPKSGLLSWQDIVCMMTP